MHIDERANVQLRQSIRGQMSLHAIFGHGANVRGRGGGDMSCTRFSFSLKLISNCVSLKVIMKYCSF